MPQTREHLEILRLLGLRHGVIAITKADLVDTTTREVVELEIRDLVQGSFLENAPILATSAHSGAGLDELKAALLATCGQVEERTGKQWFRLAIDRSFIVQGHGTVVTGSVASGSLAVGDEGRMVATRRESAGALAATSRGIGARSPCRSTGRSQSCGCASRGSAARPGDRHARFSSACAGGHRPTALPRRHAPADQAPSAGEIPSGRL